MSAEDFGDNLKAAPDPFDLREDPFKPTPDPRFLYHGAAYRAVSQQLAGRLVEAAPVLLLIGGPGMGKTTLLHQLAVSQSEVGRQVLFPSYTRLSFADLVQSCRELAGLEPLPVAEDPDGRAFVTDIAQSGRPTIVLVDEAQVMDDHDLSGLCAMVADQAEGPGRLRILLAGQPELVRRLEHSDSEAARTAAATHLALSGLDRGEVGAYVAHRLQTAGGAPDLFEPAAIARIAELSGGVPRLVNRLCSTGIFFAREEGEGRVSAEVIEATIPLCLPDHEAIGSGADEDGLLSSEPAVPSIASLLVRADEARNGQRDDQTEQPDRELSTEPPARALGAGEAVDREKPVQDAADPSVEKPGAGLAAAERATVEPAAPDEPAAPPPAPAPTAGEATTESLPASARDGAADAAEPVPAHILLAAHRRRRQRSRYIGIAAGFLFGILMGGAAMIGYLLWPEEQRDLWASLTGALGPGGAATTTPADSVPDATASVDAARSPSIVQTEPIPAADSAPQAPAVTEPAPSAAALSVADATGQEDQPVSLQLAVTNADAASGSGVLVQGLPDGAALSAGQRQDDGTWRLGLGELAGLSLTSPAHFSGRLELTALLLPPPADPTLAAVPVEAVQAAFAVTIEGQPDAPLLEAAPAAGAQGEAVPLSIQAQLVDRDGSETLEVVVSGLPAGGRLSAGERATATSWRLAPSQLRDLSLLAPPEFAGSLELTVTAAAVESDGDRAERSARLPVEIEPVLTPPTLRVAAASGREDEVIPLTIEITADDLRVRDKLQLAVKNLPAGTALSAGAAAPDGAWQLELAQLEGLTLTPPPNFSGRMDLTVEAAAADAPETKVQAALKVAVTARADWPQLVVVNAEGVEDSAIPLNIEARLSDSDGSETLQVVVAGVPKGGRLSAGKEEGAGRWRLAATDLPELRLLPPAGFAGTISLAVKAVAAEAAGDSATAQAGLTVTVAAVADQPKITAASARGLEDTAIALNIVAAAQDPDGSEAIALVLTGLPTEAGLSAGTRQDDGSWKLSISELKGLTLQPAADFSGVLSLAATATAEEANGSMAKAQAEFTVTVLATADRPQLSVAAASGPEDTAIPLAITAAPADGDAGAVLSLSVADLPKGAVLSAGRQADAGTWRLETPDLAGLTLTPPAHFSGPLALTVTAEARAEAGDAATTAQSLMVVVGAEADKPTLTAQPAQGREDEALPLKVAASLVDQDGSEELSLVVAGLPEGARLSAGEPGEGGLWQIAPAALADLRLLPSPHASGSFALNITAIAQEATGETAEATASLPVVLSAVADPPKVRFVSSEGREDEALPLLLTGELVDQDGSEVLELQVSGLPKGASLSASQAGEDGIWRLAAADLDGLQLQPAKDFSGSIELTVTAVSRELEGDTATATAKASLAVVAVADAPELVVAARHEGLEDSAIALPIEAAATDRDGSESLVVEVSGLPAGWRLSAGSPQAEGLWRLAPEQLDGLAVEPAADASGEAILTLVARATEPSGETAETTRTTTIAVAGQADAPTLVVAEAVGREDEPLPLDIQAGLPDSDGSETLSIALAGLPPGATLSAGKETEAGAWQLEAQDLPGLMLVPPQDFSGAFELALTVRAVEADGDAAESQGTLAVRIAGRADQPQLQLKPAAGRQGATIPLAVAATLADQDGSETLALEIAGLPPGARLSKGQADAEGIWRLAPEDLAGLAFEPPNDLSGTVVLTVAAVASEADGGSRAASAPLAIEIEAVSVKPELVVSDAAGREDQAIPLVILPKAAEGRADEALVIVISGLPKGAGLSAGTRLESGDWQLSQDQLSGLTLLPAADFSGPLALTVTAASGDASAEDVTASAALVVKVEAVADAPALRVGDVRGLSGKPLDLQIEAALSDLDGSESLVVEVGALPAGAGLSAGKATGGGTWQVEAGQLSGLKLLPPDHVSGSFQLAVLARSREADGTEAKTEAMMAVVLEDEPPVLVLGDEAVAAAAKVEVLATAESLAAPMESALPKPAEQPARAEQPVVERQLAQAAESETATEWLNRGNELLKLGDVAAARLFYDLAVEEGSRRAITAMGKTYDPQMLRRLGVIGLPGEPAKARKWYQRAADQGDAEAAELLKGLSGN